MPIKYLSQHPSLEEFGSDQSAYEHWSSSACGATCVLMVLHNFTDIQLTHFDVIQQLINNDGFISGVGWKHQAMADLLTETGITSYCDTKMTIKSLLDYVDNNRWIIASVKSRVAVGGGHLVIVTGRRGADLFVLDPYDLDGQGGYQTVNLLQFDSIFNDRGIVIEVPYRNSIQVTRVRWQPEDYELYDGPTHYDE